MTIISIAQGQVATRLDFIFAKMRLTVKSRLKVPGAETPYYNDLTTCFGVSAKYLAETPIGTLNNQAVVFFGASDTVVAHSFVVDLRTLQVVSDNASHGQIIEGAYVAPTAHGKPPIHKVYNAGTLRRALLSDRAPDKLVVELPEIHKLYKDKLRNI